MVEHRHSHREAERSGGTVAVLPSRAASSERSRSEAGSRASDDEGIGTLHGHFAVFNRWTLIDSFFEGRFMERIAPGAFKKTMSENVGAMRCLFNHGKDPTLGLKSLGKIRSLEEDETGARYEVDLFDTSFNRDLLPGLKGEQYGASFRFRVLREDVDSRPPRSDFNPEGIEERTITECMVREFGPVTFAAYQDATAGVRSEAVAMSSSTRSEGSFTTARWSSSRRGTIQRGDKPWRLGERSGRLPEQSDRCRFRDGYGFTNIRLAAGARGELLSVIGATVEQDHRETGGLLIGAASPGLLEVLSATGPLSDGMRSSTRTYNSFILEPTLALKLAEEVREESGGSRWAVGTFHCHPPYSPPGHSPSDLHSWSAKRRDFQLQRFASLLATRNADGWQLEAFVVRAGAGGREVCERSRLV